jgi:hypothetical protein
MTSYRHTQVGFTLIFGLLTIAVVAGVVITMATNSLIGTIIALLVLITTVVFSKLTISIDDVYVRAIFGPGVTFRKIRLADIAACEAIRIRWWYGWGIHLTPYGWLYNISGWDAVAITLRNGRRVSLGTDQPGELCEAIRRLASPR